MAKLISVLNMKGGVGKTTISFNLAEELVEMGKKVLIIDLDPQSSLTQFILGEDKAISIFYDGSITIFDLFEYEKDFDESKLIYKTNKENLKIIPSSLRLSKALAYPHDKIILGFNKYINKIKASIDYDYVIVDCPPFESVFNRATYHVSDFIINPVTISKFSILGIYLLKESMEEYCDLYNRDIKGGTVINAYDINDTTINKVELESAIENVVNELSDETYLDWCLFDTKILYSKSHKTSVYEGTSLRNTSYCRFDVKHNFRRFVNELIVNLDALS